jgi:hypothetical protein
MLIEGVPTVVPAGADGVLAVVEPFFPTNAKAIPAAAAAPRPIHNHFLLLPLAPVPGVVVVICTLGGATGSPAEAPEDEINFWRSSCLAFGSAG